jgi:hypothetical protein
MDQNLKRLVEELGAAINESLAESGQIAEAIANIRRDGYDVFLVLNATIAIKNREAEPVGLLARSNGAVGFGPQDIKFLKSMHISVNG